MAQYAPMLTRMLITPSKMTKTISHENGGGSICTYKSMTMRTCRLLRTSQQYLELVYHRKHLPASQPRRTAPYESRTRVAGTIVKYSSLLQGTAVASISEGEMSGASV